MVAGVCLVLGLTVVRMGQVPALLVPTAVGVLALIALVRKFVPDNGEDRLIASLWRWTFASLVIHLLFALAVNFGGASSYLGPDASTYHRGALGIVDHWQNGLPMPSLPGGKEAYYFLLAALYWIFGPHELAGLAVNAVLAAAIVPVVADTTYRLFGARATRLVMPVMVLVPGMILWTSQLLKEAPILFLLAVAVNCGIRLVERVTLAPMVVLAATLPLLLSFRGPVGVAVILGVAGGVALGKSNLTSGVVAAVALIGLIAAVLGAGLGSSGYNTAVGTDLKQANLVRQDLSTSAASGFDRSADISTPEKAVSYLPRGLVALTFGPLPWQLRGLRQLVSLPDLLAWYFLLPSLVRGARTAQRTAGRRPLVLLLPGLIITLLLALVIGNYGTIVRERMQILVILAPVIALGLARRRAQPGLKTEPQAQLVS